MQEYEREILKEVERELLKEDPIIQFFEIVQFQSKSKGKKKKRKFPKMIILIRPRGSKRWYFWNGESDCNLPWDEWAIEVFEFSQEKYLGDALRSEINNLLNNFQKI